MKAYSFWQVLFRSFWSSEFYRAVVNEWRGLGYQYVFLVVCLTAFLIALQTQFVTAPLLDQWIDAISVESPGIVVIQKGILSINKQSPYTMTDPKSGKPMVTFDTRLNPENLELSKSVLLVTRTALCMKNPPSLGDQQQMSRIPTLDSNSNLMVIEDFSSIDQFVLETSSLTSAIHLFLQCLGLLTFIFCALGGFIFCIFQTLIYGLIGKMLCSIASISLDYRTLVRLCSVALTPVLVLDALLKILVDSASKIASGTAITVTSTYIGCCFNPQLDPMTGIIWSCVSVLLTLAYLYFGIVSNSKQKSG